MGAEKPIGADCQSERNAAMNVHDSASGKGDATNNATLIHRGKEVSLPVRSGSIGPSVIDVARL